MKSTYTTAFVAIAAGASAFVPIPPANAVLQISGLVGGIAVQCADGQACDTNSNPGQLEIDDAVLGGVQFIGSSQTQSTGEANSLNSSTFQIINNTGAPIEIDLAISGTSFSAPTTFYSASGGGTFQNAIGSDITLSYYGDAGNAQGADLPTDAPGTPLQTFSDSATLLTDTFGFNSGTVPFVFDGPFSMTLLASGTLYDTASTAVSGQLVGRTQAIVTDVSTPIPEPGSLALIGSGLLGMGWFFNRRNRKNGNQVTTA